MGQGEDVEQGAADWRAADWIVVFEFRDAAEASGLIWQGDPFDQKLIDFAGRGVERCARIAESFVDDHDRSAADAIGAELGEH